MKTICGADCSNCGMQESCAGCVETNGRPLGGECVAAVCYKSGGEKCFLACKQQIIEEFNALGIADMPPITDLCQLAGVYVNLPYTLSNGQTIKLLTTGKFISVIRLRRKTATGGMDLWQTESICWCVNMVVMAKILRLFS